ncbi:hypothetical protein M9Y10_040904 [Tritrichomonas musculus]|uniref:Myb-like DNA-binding domain containing protein n=1 Tax=Tritrichomonas musculus TaxID=1915356 RepID=A0ABR2K3Z9_9EUKA
MNPQSIQPMIPIAPTRNRRRNNVSSKNKKWTPEEDALLRKIASERETSINWKAAENQFPGKTSQQIFERWTKVLDPGLLKGSWTRQEDEVIINFVHTYGCKSWTKLASLLPGRIGKQCRERWLNHLNPELNRGPWTPEEDQQLLLLHEQFGNHWSKISYLMPSRADNMIKNRWYSTLSKKTKAEVEESIKNLKMNPPTPIINNGAATQQLTNQSPSLNYMNPLASNLPNQSPTSNTIVQINNNDGTNIPPSFTPTKVKFNAPSGQFQPPPPQPQPQTPPQQQQPENLPKPQPFEEMSIDTPSIWTPSYNNTLFSGTPVGFISPMMPSASPFALLSPYKKMTPMFSPWAADTSKNCFMSPINQKCSPPSLSENRAELMNLIVHQ